MSMWVCACVCAPTLACVLCVSKCVCVCVCMCVCVRVCSVCVSCASMCVRVFLARVCVFECVCLGQTSSVMLRIQSSPDGADSHFVRWLTDFHVINNNCSAVVPLPNNFLYCSPTEEDEGNFYLILISLFWILLHLISRKTNSMVKPGVCSPAVDWN